MLAVSFFVLLFLALLKPKSKLLQFAILLLAFLVFAFSNSSGDVSTYRDVYNGLGAFELIAHFEPVFSLPMATLKIMGMPFGVFRILFSLAFFVLFIIFVDKLTEYRALATILFFVFPGIYFSDVMRSGLASLVVSFALFELVEGGRNAKKRCVMLVLLATLIHYSSIVFLAFLLIDLRKKISLRRFIYCFVPVLFLGIILNYTDLFYSLANIITNREKTLQWFVRGDAATNIKGIIIAALMLFVDVAISAKSHEISHCRAAKSILSDKERTLSVVVYNISILMLFVLPIVMFASPFMRIPYMTLLISLCSWLNAVRVVRCSSTIKTEKLKLLTMVVAVFFAWKVYENLPYLKQGSVLFGEIISPSFIF